MKKNMYEAGDEELIRSYLDDDIEAFSILYERYRKRLYAYINGMLPRRHSLADDIFQQTWIRVVEKLPVYRHQGSFQAWITRIAHNIAVDHFRKEKRETSMDSIEDSGAVFADAGTEPWRELDRKYMGELIRACLDNLNPEQREVFVLRHNEVAFRDISEIQGCSINTTLARMQYALKNLRNCITDNIQAKRNGQV